jgi:NADH:ubiquinone oxidoreductase subunit 6 (subunit J)|tara:strand:+ start:1575 stop:2072 length:498 start_codon:yes stop_codon:yes gene_type:complete
MIDLSEILFYLVAALILFGAAGVVLSRNIVYAAVGLLLTMLGTAGLFILVFAEFLALVQVLIYGGAVVVLILFAVMLTRIDDFRNLTDNGQQLVGAVLSIIVVITLIAAILTTSIEQTSLSGIGIQELGIVLFSDWAIPFEIASLVLLIALIGSVVLVKRGERGD